MESLNLETRRSNSDGILAVSSDDLTLNLHAKVSSCYQQAESYYIKAFPRPEVLLNLRGQSAGVAELQKNRLRFNRIIYLENQAAFLKEVVPHEVAHLLAWQIYGRNIRPHGSQWQEIMRWVFNLEPKRTHSFNVQNAANLHFIYGCACPHKKHALSKRRHNKIVQGNKYICTLCQSGLRFLKQN